MKIFHWFLFECTYFFNILIFLTSLSRVDRLDDLVSIVYTTVDCPFDILSALISILSSVFIFIYSVRYISKCSKPLYILIPSLLIQINQFLATKLEFYISTERLIHITNVSIRVRPEYQELTTLSTSKNNLISWDSCRYHNITDNMKRPYCRCVLVDLCFIYQFRNFVFGRFYRSTVCFSTLKVNSSLFLFSSDKAVLKFIYRGVFTCFLDLSQNGFWFMASYVGNICFLLIGQAIQMNL